MTETQNTSDWALPVTTPDISDDRSGRSADDLENWKRLTRQVQEVATREGWTKSEFSRRSGVANGTFSGWYSGQYKGRLDATNEKIEKFLASLDEMAELVAVVPSSPDFIPTMMAKEILETLAFAQCMPDFVTVTAAAGTGKTTACRHYAATRSNVWMITISPHTKTVHGTLVELATEMDIVQHNPAKLTRAIGNRLRKVGSGTLLIIDEAQNLVDDAINQLRHFVDNYGCGLALIGNDEIYSRFTKRTDGPSYAQLKRRIGKRVRRTKPHVEDIKMLLDGWGISEPDVRKVLIGIGHKDGALGQIDKTIKLALMHSGGKTLTAEAVRAAWANRDVEGL